jgi:hypothetical protein
VNLAVEDLRMSTERIPLAVLLGFCSGFGAYDSKKKEWREPLLRALVDNP